MTDNCWMHFQLLQRLEKAAYPTIGEVTAHIAFVNFWLSQQPQHVDMDHNSGLPPDSWVTKVKEAINRIYSCMEGKG